MSGPLNKAFWDQGQYQKIRDCPGNSVTVPGIPGQLEPMPIVYT